MIPLTCCRDYSRVQLQYFTCLPHHQKHVLLWLCVSTSLWSNVIVQCVVHSLFWHECAAQENNSGNAFSQVTSEDVRKCTHVVWNQIASIFCPVSPLSQVSNATSTMFFMTGRNSEVSRASWRLAGPCITLLSHSSTTRRSCHRGKVCSRSPRLTARTAWAPQQESWTQYTFNNVLCLSRLHSGNHFMHVCVTCSIAIYVGSISGHSCVTHSYSIAENSSRESALCKTAQKLCSKHICWKRRYKVNIKHMLYFSIKMICTNCIWCKTNSK